MKRRIIEIDEARCNGCGLCANACHEGAIAVTDGKAKLLRDDYCDGMGDCLPACPMDAIHFTEREAATYDEEAVRTHRAARAGEGTAHPDGAVTPEALPCGCPGALSRSIAHGGDSGAEAESGCAQTPSRLNNWPVQIQLAPVKAPYFDNCELLIAADCTAYACGGFHEKFMKDRATLIGCPKLDGINYAEKLAAILAANDIKGVTLTRMLVPCCGGLERMAKEAIKRSGRDIPLEVVTIAMDGSTVGAGQGFRSETR